MVVFHNEQHFDANMISRIRNVLVSALNKQESLPKLIIFALDDDIIKFVDFEKYGASLALGKIMDALVESVNDVIKQRKEQLPKKALKDTHFIWMGAPIHQAFSDAENSLRVKLNTAMESIIKQFSNMSFLQVRKGWMVDNHRMMKNNSYTVEGSKIYWRAIDSAAKFWLLKKNAQQIIQHGPQLGSLQGEAKNKFKDSGTESNENSNTSRVRSQVVKVQHDNHGGSILFTDRNLEQDQGNKSRRLVDVDNSYPRARFDRYHWYRNSSDMERGFGELRRRQLTPKKFKRKLNF